MVIELRARPSAGQWWVPVAVTGATALLVVLAVLFVDRDVSTWSHDVLHRPGWGVSLTRLASVNVMLPIAAVGLIVSLGYYVVDGSFTYAWRTIMAACLALLIAALLASLLKDVAGRTWPETWIHNNPSWIKDHRFEFDPFHADAAYGSFPSGHTTRMTAPFAVLWQRLPRFRLIWILPTALIMTGLITSDFHWVSDCIAGAWLGAACAWVVLLFVREPSPY